MGDQRQTLVTDNLLLNIIISLRSKLSDHTSVWVSQNLQLPHKVIPANSEYQLILNSSGKMIHNYESTDSCTTVLDTQVGVGGSFYTEPSLGARAKASWCKVMNCALHQLLTCVHNLLPWETSQNSWNADAYLMLEKI